MTVWPRRLFALAVVSSVAACGGSDEITMDPPQRIAQVAQTDMLASNGVIHATDKVLLPAP